MRENFICVIIILFFLFKNAHACFSPTAHEGNVYAEASDDRVRQAIDYQIASESDVPKVQATDNKRPASVVDNSKPTLAAMVANKQLVQQPGSPARRLSDGDSVSETDTSSSSSQSRTSSQSRSHIVEVDQHTNLTNGDDEVTSARPPFEVSKVCFSLGEFSFNLMHKQLTLLGL